jgi:hypothetical protein
LGWNNANPPSSPYPDSSNTVMSGTPCWCCYAPKASTLLTSQASFQQLVREYSVKTLVTKHTPSTGTCGTPGSHTREWQREYRTCGHSSRRVSSSSGGAQQRECNAGAPMSRSPNSGRSGRSRSGAGRHSESAPPCVPVICSRGNRPPTPQPARPVTTRCCLQNSGMNNYTALDTLSSIFDLGTSN